MYEPNVTKSADATTTDTNASATAEYFAAATGTEAESPGKITRTAETTVSGNVKFAATTVLDYETAIKTRC